MSNPQNQLNPSHKTEASEPSRKSFTSAQLGHEKIQAREKLLSMSPEMAQKQVEQTLYPQHWEYQATESPWDESIPTHYGETDP